LNVVVWVIVTVFLLLLSPDSERLLPDELVSESAGLDETGSETVLLPDPVIVDTVDSSELTDDS
jgi:hypothetical protein